MIQRRSFFRWISGAVFLATANHVHADQSTPLTQIATDVERSLGGRVGIAIIDTGSSWVWRHRSTERFPMNSTFKAPLCGAILARADAGTLALNETVAITADDIVPFAPVTAEKIGQTMTIGELCHATLDRSDNTAANLLIDRLGGTTAVTDYLRSIGDGTTRLDRMEPDLNNHTPGDPRDTTTPSAMADTWRTLLVGDALNDTSRAQLIAWMAQGSATGNLIRPSLPAGWIIADKSGGGRTGSRSVVALITPPQDAPYIVAIYLADTPADWDTRNSAIARLGAAVIDLIASR